jgi:hypothetical protein
MPTVSVDWSIGWGVSLGLWVYGTVQVCVLGTYLGMYLHNST